jgi:Cof subfamily protein (haloacid dehalogenase superfamily)
LPVLIADFLVAQYLEMNGTPMTYRLIALDVDGTTVDTGREPSQRVLDALAQAQACGVKVVLATGRAPDSAREYATALGVKGPLVCLQGALVKEQADGTETLMADCLPEEPLRDAIQFADERGLEFTLYTEDAIYVSHMYSSREYYDLWFSLPVHHVPDLAEAAGSLYRAGVPLVKGLFIGQPAGLSPLEADLNARLGGRLEVMRSHANFLEVLAPGVSKARAIAFLAGRYGIAQHETIAVGDSGNDISMIRWAGLGVAMENASLDVRAAANWIAPSVSDDGVAAVIDRFILNGKNLVWAP